MTKRAIVYIDGYNFYYGRLREGPYKWLDLVKLFKGILHIQDPTSELVKLNYFTSDAKARYARHAQASVHAQGVYHKVLRHLYSSGRFEIIRGTHEIQPVHLPRAMKGNNRIDRDDKVRVWRVIEKKTDIQLALAMYADAARKACDLMILCSNDSDLQPALEKIRQDFPRMEVGFIAGVPPPDSTTPEGRRPNQSLGNLAHWTRDSISDAELAAAQMPSEIKTGSGTVWKPMHW